MEDILIKITIIICTLLILWIIGLIIWDRFDIPGKRVHRKEFEKEFSLRHQVASRKEYKKRYRKEFKREYRKRKELQKIFQKREEKNKPPKKVNWDSIISIGCLPLLLLLIFILSQIDTEVWVILFFLLFAGAGLFSIIGPLFIGEIPFMGAGSEAKGGCLLLIIIIVILLIAFGNMFVET